MHELLDAGHGACELKKEVIRQLVVEALRHFDESRYLLGGFVVMPNHVHALVQCLGETRLKPMCASWKRFTARRIHELLDQTGHFWHGETYDHIVRSQSEFLHYRDYIRQNPAKAGLKEGEYSLFLPELAE
jgi:REP element-mobilizing transposase RayT